MLARFRSVRPPSPTIRSQAVPGQTSSQGEEAQTEPISRPSKPKGNGPDTMPVNDSESNTDHSVRQSRKGKLNISDSLPAIPQNLVVTAQGEISTPSREQPPSLDATTSDDRAAPQSLKDEGVNTDFENMPEDLATNSVSAQKLSLLEDAKLSDPTNVTQITSHDPPLHATPETVQPVESAGIGSSHIDTNPPSLPLSRIDSEGDHSSHTPLATPLALSAPPVSPSKPDIPKMKVTSDLPKAIAPADILRLKPETIAPTSDGQNFPTAEDFNNALALSPQRATLPISSDPAEDFSTIKLPALDPHAVSMPIGVPSTPADNPVLAPLSLRRRLIRKARSLVLRRQLLAVVLGREIADIVHPQLQNPGKETSGIANPTSVKGIAQVDGTSHSRIYVSEKWQERKARRIGTLDEKILEAASQADAERKIKCVVCGGVFNNAAIKRHHKLISKKDKKDLGQNRKRRISDKNDIPLQCRCPQSRSRT